MERMKILSNKKYNRLIIEIETLKEIIENDEMCINMMADRINRLEKLEQENKKLNEKVRFLEEYLDRKEKLNESYRKEIKDHQLYEKKLEHRIIEFEELLHGE